MEKRTWIVLPSFFSNPIVGCRVSRVAARRLFYRVLLAVFPLFRRPLGRREPYRDPMAVCWPLRFHRVDIAMVYGVYRVLFWERGFT